MTVIRASLPYYVDSINLAFTSSNVSVTLGVIVGSTAVGLFSTAIVAMAVPMFFAPMLTWVLTPTLSRLHDVDAGLMWIKVGNLVEVSVIGLCVTRRYCVRFQTLDVATIRFGIHGRR